jgi:hypothetical protein
MIRYTFTLHCDNEIIDGTLVDVEAENLPEAKAKVNTILADSKLENPRVVFKMGVLS